ncbi:hypothetical protein FRB90_011142 [Tulasnella sp. 427]|nr:hypothetical protein FRB90_011142 [Tulasnella sp. 427]
MSLSRDLKDVATFGPGGKLPDKKKDVQAWNATWNKYLEWAYSASRSVKSRGNPPKWATLFEMFKNPLTSREALASAKEVSTKLWKMQAGLNEFLGTQMIAFAIEWLNMESQDRLRHIAKGLAQLCNLADYELQRLFCPESTDAFLERDSGRGLLDLITTFFPPPELNSKLQTQDGPILLFHHHYSEIMGFNQPCPSGQDPALWDLIRENNECFRADFIFKYEKANMEGRKSVLSIPTFVQS